jgi:hypothetical protein
VSDPLNDVSVDLLTTMNQYRPRAGFALLAFALALGASVADSTSTSDASGYARTTYTAGPRVGAGTVVATVAQLWTTSFTIYIEAP